MNTTTMTHSVADDVQGYFLPLVVLGIGLLVAGCETNTSTNANTAVGSPGTKQGNGGTNTQTTRGGRPRPQ